MPIGIVSLSLVVGGMLGTLLGIGMTAVVGLSPALHAARLEPIEAQRPE